jgi:hypothetical protein
VKKIRPRAWRHGIVGVPSYTYSVNVRPPLLWDFSFHQWVIDARCVDTFDTFNLKIRQICLAPSVSNHSVMRRRIPEVQRSKLHRYESLKALSWKVEIFSETSLNIQGLAQRCILFNVFCCVQKLLQGLICSYAYVFITLPCRLPSCLTNLGSYLCNGQRKLKVCHNPRRL